MYVSSLPTVLAGVADVRVWTVAREVRVIGVGTFEASSSIQTRFAVRLADFRWKM